MHNYFAVSIIAASMALGACSGSSGTDASVLNEPGETQAPDDPQTQSPADDAVPDSTPDFTPSGAATALNTISQSADHTTLFQAINASGSAARLDSSAEMFTVFAPTNAAFQAFIDADQNDAFASVADLLDGANQVAVERLLLAHVVPSIVLSGAIADLAASGDEVATLVSDAPLRFATTSTVPPSAVLFDVIGAVDGSAPVALSSSIDLGSDLTIGVVHSIDTVIPVPAPSSVFLPPAPP